MLGTGWSTQTREIMFGVSWPPHANAFGVRTPSRRQTLMKASAISCIICIILGCVQLGFAANALAEGATSTSLYFIIPGGIAVLVGLIGLLILVINQYQPIVILRARLPLVPTVGVMALVTGISTTVLAFYLATLGVGA